MKRDSYSTRVSWHEHMSDTDMILMIHKRLELQSYDLSAMVMRGTVGTVSH